LLINSKTRKLIRESEQKVVNLVSEKKKKSTIAKVTQVVVWMMLIVTILGAVIGGISGFM
jgi:cell division septal protein FtsQ